MAKIKMKSPAAAQSALTFAQLYERFLIDRTAQGLAEKTLQSYRTHLKSIAKHLDISFVIGIPPPMPREGEPSRGLMSVTR